MRILLVLATLVLVTCGEIIDYNPEADPKAIVQSGKARFTVLTSRMIRMEYGSFESKATTAIVNRRLPVPKFTSTTNSTEITITTADLKLIYQTNQSFGPGSLQVQSLNPSSTFKGWTAGDRNDGNLLGTIRSLDQLAYVDLNCTNNANIRVHDEGLHCGWGLVSRDGWALVDDSDTPTINPKTTWWEGTNADQFDWYLLAHGSDYRGAINDWVQISGKVAMVPRAANGIWWTRWYDLTDGDTRQVVDDYESRSLPLDVFVLDMDWHTKNAWGGYTWDRHLFPYPNDTVDYLHERGLYLAANIHDDNGVGPWEDEYAAVAKVMGVDPSSNQTIPFQFCSNQTYAYAVDDIVLEHTSIDFWWIDWQQGGALGGCTGGKMNPTIWTNRVRGLHNQRKGINERGIVLARWGGYGSQRYQVGFSGDVMGLTWDNLVFQPYFSATAANVAYGFWSHDLVGPGNDLELYTRWLQWGSLSGVFRSHDRGMSAGSCFNNFPPNEDDCPVVQLWKVPVRYFEANRDAVTLRAELLPYLYTLTRHAFDTGLGPLRPMYYDWPHEDNAYQMDGTTKTRFCQYMLGDDLLISPVVSASSTSTNSLANKQTWLPPNNEWIELTSHTQYKGGQVLNKQYDLNEIPVFVKAGSIIPARPVRAGNTIGLAMQQFNELSFEMFPPPLSDASSAYTSSTKVYEDDGHTMDYLKDQYAWTTVSYTSSTNDQVTITMNTAGSYDKFPSQRSSVSFLLVNARPPTSVQFASASISASQSIDVTYSRRSRFRNGDNNNNNNIFGLKNTPTATWTYLGDDTTLLIEISNVPTSQALKLVVSGSGWGQVLVEDSPVSTSVQQSLSGIKGAIARANTAKHSLDQTRSTLGSQKVRGGQLMDASSFGSTLSHLASASASAFMQAVQQYPSLYKKAYNEASSISGQNQDRMNYVKALLTEGEYGNLYRI